jgi:HK97 family phage prohead protease
MENKQFRFLEVKALDEDQRIITGIATTPNVDRTGDIVDPLGAKFADEIPFLWQHDHEKPVGFCKLGKPTAKGIPFTARLAKIAEEGKLKDQVDLAWHSIKSGLVRCVSIGFRPIEYNLMDTGGIRFAEYEIFELSAVTIPANADATIQTLKALEEGYRAGMPVRLVSAKKAERGDTVRLVSNK